MKPYDVDIECQTVRNIHIAAIIAARHGVQTREVVARMVTLSHEAYERSTRMTAEEAAARFVEPTTSNDGEAPVRSGSWRRNGCLAVAAILVGLFIYWLWFVPAPVPHEVETVTSPRYQACESDLKPKLEYCLKSLSESNWGMCKQAYMRDFELCIK
ncbi:MAG: hypothetical protein KAY22_10325 [Rhizorhabdus sp.]|uniref:hypothetical protein n=1 Tax=Rhizorhabdus sp. TaxID=1968843 RepID=UPI001B764465|nr:hypothetical protein [Rhizorhabdus sp.]MBP8232691.1 hypothetical protein [Rhizorhabdus sp.]